MTPQPFGCNNNHNVKAFTSILFNSYTIVLKFHHISKHEPWLIALICPCQNSIWTFYSKSIRPCKVQILQQFWSLKANKSMWLVKNIPWLTANCKLQRVQLWFLLNYKLLKHDVLVNDCVFWGNHTVNKIESEPEILQANPIHVCSFFGHFKKFKNMFLNSLCENAKNRNTRVLDVERKFSHFRVSYINSILYME